jgi:hypothetical protein
MPSVLRRPQRSYAKCNVHPRKGHEGREGEPIYSSILSLTSALDGVGC